MAISKDAVQAKFLVKFPKVNLSKTFKDSLIKRIADKLDSEDEIDATLDVYDPIIVDAAAEADRIRTASKKELDALKKPVIETTEEKPVDELPADTPEYIKQLLGVVTKLSTKVDAFEQNKVKDTLTDRFNKDERIKDIPAFMRTGYIPKTEEEFEAKVLELSTEYTTFAQEKKLDLAGTDATGKAITSKAVSEKQVEDGIKQWAQQAVPQKTTATV